VKIKRGSTSVRRLIFIADSSSTTGAGLANLTHSTSGLVAYYYAGDLSNEVQITLVTATLGTFASGGFVAVDNTNMPGWYEVGIPDAALDGGNEVCIQYRGAANMVPVNIYIQLDAVDYQTDAFGALKPTTAGRTLDVSAGGEAGIDLANVGSPATTLTLSGTTIKAVTDAVALPSSASINITGNITGNLSGSVGSVTGSVGSVTGNVGGNVAGSVNSVTSPVTVGTNNDKTGYALTQAFPSNFAALGITVGGAVTVGTNNDKTGYSLAVAPPTAGTIADAVWDEAYNQHTTAGTFGKLMDLLRKANTVIEGTVTSATSPTTTAFTSDVNYPTGAFKHAVLLWTGGALNEQNSPILTYANTNGAITVEEAFTAAPQVGDAFIIIPTTHVHSVAAIAAGVAATEVMTDLDTMIVNDGTANARFSTSALQNAPTGGGGGGTGTGARTVVVTVTLSASPVEGASVRLTKAAETYVGSTNASGQVTFNVDDGTWTVAITSPGATFAGASLVVDDDETVSYSLTAISITPSPATQITGYYTCYSHLGVVEAGVSITMQLVGLAQGSVGLALDNRLRTVTSDANGVAQFTNLFPGCRYKVYRGAAENKAWYVSLPDTVTGDPVELGSIYGDDE
jgi:hypothetical protein